MRLKVLDQIQVTAVQPDVLKPGREIEVSDDLGSDLLKRNPRNFAALDTPSPETEPMPAEKSAPAPQNKAEPAAPANKTTSPRKTKGK